MAKGRRSCWEKSRPIRHTRIAVCDSLLLHQFLASLHVTDSRKLRVVGQAKAPRQEILEQDQLLMVMVHDTVLSLSLLSVL